MKQLLTAFFVASVAACIAPSANAAMSTDKPLTLEAPDLLVASENPTDTMLTQCYGGGGYSYGYAPVYRSTRYYYPQRSGVSISIGGGGYRGYPGYSRGYGPRYGGGYRGYGGGYRGGFGPGVSFGRGGGVGFFLSL